MKIKQIPEVLMGHITTGDRTYHLLQQRLDRNITGAPDSPVFIQILKLLFSEEEADLARRLPLRPTPLSTVAAKLGLEENRLLDKINRMAERGLVFDAEHRGIRYLVLAPVVIGFFEFIFMRARQDLPLTELAKLFEEYMMQDDRFAHAVFEGNTQLGRTLVHEEALPVTNFSEILDWEKASRIIRTASSAAVSLCACRHKASHLGKACANDQLTCLTLNNGAEMLIKKNFASRISADQALDILARSKAAGMMQVADNVKYGVGFICNCCSCCCGMLKAAKTFHLQQAIVTSNWIMSVNPLKCKGCGRCQAACPPEALTMKAAEEAAASGGRVAVVREELCLGCSVCHSVCPCGAITMIPRAKRVFTPETTFDKFAVMALERGKLSNLLFDDYEKLSHRALGRLLQLIERSAPVRSLVRNENIRSTFLGMLVNKAKNMGN